MSLIGTVYCIKCGKRCLYLYPGGYCSKCCSCDYTTPPMGCRPDPVELERRIRYYRERASKGLPLFTDIRGRECG